MLNSNRIFKSVRVIPDWIRGHFIQWELDPFFKGAPPYNFSLEIADNEEFSEVLFSYPNLGDVFWTVDNSKIQQNLSATYAYRVTLTTGDGKQYSSVPILFGAARKDQRKYAMAAKIIGKELQAMRYGGSEGWLLRRKLHGDTPVRPKAVRNVDPVSGVPMTDTKQEDYGVGSVGGYFDPVPIAYKPDNTVQDKQLNPNGTGVTEEYRMSARISPYPIITSRDIICDAEDGSRYNINKFHYKLFPGTNIVVVQGADLSLIPYTDTVYSIPLPIPTK